MNAKINRQYLIRQLAARVNDKSKVFDRAWMKIHVPLNYMDILHDLLTFDKAVEWDKVFGQYGITARIRKGSWLEIKWFPPTSKPQIQSPTEETLDMYVRFNFKYIINSLPLNAQEMLEH